MGGGVAYPYHHTHDKVAETGKEDEHLRAIVDMGR